MAGFKARGLKGGNGGGDFPKVDWQAIADQVEDGAQSARIVGLVDLGMHTEGKMLSDKGFTGFLTEEDAEAWIDAVSEQYPKHDLVKDEALSIELADEVDFDVQKTKVLKRKGKDFVEVDEDAVYIVEANVFGGEREYQEIALIADLVDTYVDYGEGIGTKQYRIVLNGVWDKTLKGFVFKKSAPTKDGGVWTVKSNSKLYEIAKSCGKQSLLEVDLDEADWSELLGQPFNIVINKNGDKGQYISAGATSPLKKKKGVLEEVEELDAEPFMIDFDCDDVEVLKSAFLRADCIKKIKMANDYSGSNLEKTIEEYEAYLKAKNKASSDAEDNDNDDDDNDAEDKPKSDRKVTKVGGSGKSKPKPKTEDGEGDEDDQGSQDDWDE